MSLTAEKTTPSRRAKGSAKPDLDMLGSLAVFDALPAAARQSLREAGEWVELRPDALLPRREVDGRRKGEERYYFVCSGQMSAVINRAPATESGAAPVHRLSTAEHLGLFTPGDLFSDAYCARSSPRDESRIDCIAMVPSTLLSVPASTLKQFMDGHPSWAAALGAQNVQIRDAYRHNREPALRVAQDFFLRQGYSFAKTLKVIELDSCIGCDACEDACGTRHGTSRLKRQGPTLGVLGFPSACRQCVDHRCVKACGFGALSMTEGQVNIDQRACAGCTACETACPNDVIEMVETAYTVDDFPKPLPDTDRAWQTNVEGLYLVGEAAGDALIKLAINAGKCAADATLDSLDGPSIANTFDVVIVGAGPAGLSAALACLERKVPFAVFDKGHYATTIMSYPKNKVVMAEPAHLPLYGDLWLRDTTKEELIGHWDEIIARTSLKIRSHEEITAVTSDDNGIFTIDTALGQYQSRSVILATGTRGSPRKLGVSGESSTRVMHALADADTYVNQHVLVVGGGDSAVETAMSLADADGTHVSLSYRKATFSRIKAGNKSRLEDYVKRGRITTLLPSTVKSLDATSATLDVDGHAQTINNQMVFAMLGAKPPTAFFERCGIRILEPGSDGMALMAKQRGTRHYANKCDQCAGFSDKACITACPTGSILEIDPQEIFPKVGEHSLTRSANDRVMRHQPFLEGLRTRARLPRVAAFFAILLASIVGAEVLLQHTWPQWSFMEWLNISLGAAAGQVSISSGRGFGHFLGYAGMGLMLVATSYPLRTRLSWFRTRSTAQGWMLAHIICGVLGPAFVTFHTLLSFGRWPSLAFWSMLLVVGTGAAGRYLATWIGRGAALLAYEREALEQSRRRLFDQWQGQRGRTGIFKAEDAWIDLKGGGGTLLLAPFVLISHHIASSLRYTWMKWFALRNVHDKLLRAETLTVFRQRARTARRQLLRHRAESSVQLWRRLHLATTVITFAITAVHVAVALLYKAT